MIEDNEYQKALNNLLLTARKTKDVNIIQELVDKETPIKPIVTIVFPLCPMCHKESVRSNDYGSIKYNRCTECGQKIDWSEE